MSLALVTTLKDCAKKKDLYKGSRVHANIQKSGFLERDTYVGNTLISMYAKCGALGRAQQMLEELRVPDVVSWNALIAGYAQHGQGRKALISLQHMQSEGLPPDAVTYACILKACGITRQADTGKIIHNEIVSQGLLRKNTVLGNALVDMYAKCGLLVKAQEVLEKLTLRDVISWNTLIAGHAQHGQGEEALICLRRMRNEDISPDAFTYASILKACGMTQDAQSGKEIHDEIVREGLLNKNIVLGNALVDMYAKCGLLKKARKVLEELPVRDVVSWNALMAGCIQQGQGEEAVGYFRKMRSEGLSPDAITYVCLLKACSIMQKAEMGKLIHDEVVSQGLLGKNAVLGNALIDMYSKCGLVMKAQKVLDDLPSRNNVSWNTLILGYVQQEQGEGAMVSYRRMQRDGLSPDAVTYICVLKACGITQDADMGKKIHGEIVNQGLLKKNVALGNSLIDMYAKCGLMMKAQEVLDGLPARDAVSWAALIAGYVQRGQNEEALGCYQRMRHEGLFADAITYACILKPCGIMQDAHLGKQIHDDIACEGLLGNDVILGNALIDMFTKCGVLTKAQHVFDELPFRDAVTWNTLIAGYAQQGAGEEALECFEQMEIEGVPENVVSWNALIAGYAQQGRADEALKCFQWMQWTGIPPNATTFVSVLNVCRHAGLIDEGQMYFENMRKKYGIMPDKKHHSCMVDLFGRASHFDKAMSVIKKMPLSDYPPIWSALLGACRKREDVKLGRLAFQHAVQLNGYNTAAFVIMANIYAAAGMQEYARLWSSGG